MEDRKYKLIREGFLSRWPVSHWGKKHLPVYRVKALRNIPKHGVNKGDLGGYVTNPLTLPHDDSSWIADEAQVFGNVFLKDDAYISGKAKVTCDSEKSVIKIEGKVRIFEEAQILLKDSPEGNPKNTIISGEVLICGNAKIRNLGYAIGRNIIIGGSADLEEVESIQGSAQISGNALLGKGVEIIGAIDKKTAISGSVALRAGSKVVNSVLNGEFTLDTGAVLSDVWIDDRGIVVNGEKVTYDAVTGLIPNAVIKVKNRSKRAITDADIKNLLKHLTDGVMDQEKALTAMEEYNKEKVVLADTKRALALEQNPELSQNRAIIDDAMLLLAEINDKNKAYETDIVKMIKYPVMVDKGYETTAEFHMALNRANRMSLNPAHPAFVDTVNAAEKAFLTAESYALKIASTGYTEVENKKVSKAKDLLAIASDEASSENEKTVAFQQAFKQLEGVIAVPEIAVETFRVKIGLKEIETLERKGS